MSNAPILPDNIQATPKNDDVGKMTSRERIDLTCRHIEPDRLAIDFGGCGQTGIHVSIVYRLRRHFGLDKPGTPVKVVEPCQMLGEIADDLAAILRSDTVSLAGTGTMYGYPMRDFKEFRLHDGTPVLVPAGFNTIHETNGHLYQYPCGDTQCRPSAVMPDKGYFFDSVDRQEPIDEDKLDPRDNLEEFVPIGGVELEHYARESKRLYETTNRALFCGFGGLSFGDVAMVPGPFLKHPKGIRDVAEWYMSLASRKNYIHAIFEKQVEIAIENLKRLHGAVGDRVSLIHTNGTDFGTQNGPFLSQKTFRELFLPYQKRLNGWIHENTHWKTFMHCCGGVRPLLDLFAEAEFDILNPVQCSANGMTAVDLKKEYGRTFVFWGGGVDTQKTLPFGTPDEVRREVRERIETFAPGGGFVFTSIHNVQALTPLDNLLAMFEVLENYAK